MGNRVHIPNLGPQITVDRNDYKCFLVPSPKVQGDVTSDPRPLCLS